MMHVNDARLLEFQMQTLSDRTQTQMRTIDGLTVEDMLVSQRRPSLFRRLRNSIRQRWNQPQPQEPVAHQPTVILNPD